MEKQMEITKSNIDSEFFCYNVIYITGRVPKSIFRYLIKRVFYAFLGNEQNFISPTWIILQLNKAETW